MDPVAIVAESALFRGLPREELEALAPDIRSRTYSKGSYVFHEGDPGTALYVVRSGQVKICRVGPGGEEAIYAVLMPGDSFGEIALLSDEAVRTADAQAMELTECVTLGRAPFLAFLDQHPPMMRHLVRALSRYVQLADESFAEVAFLDITGRVARKLLDLAGEHGEKTAEGTRIKMRLSQRTLASMVAASRENVNRALHRFTVRGDIKQEGGVITIVRPAELRKRA
jgi:CRP-like cAMP-binding protein